MPRVGVGIALLLACFSFMTDLLSSRMLKPKALTVCHSKADCVCEMMFRCQFVDNVQDSSIYQIHLKPQGIALCCLVASQK